MKINIIQYHTEFHLLMSAASLDSTEELKNTTLIGPKNNIADILILHGAKHIEKDCRGDIHKSIPPIWATNNGITIYTSFLIPFTALNYLKKKKLKAGKIIRTDEGLGSFSNFSHIYSSISNSSQNKITPIKAFLLTLIHRTIEKMTRINPAYDLDFLFLPDQSINKEKQIRAKIILQNLQDTTLNNYVVFVSQPGLEKNFNTLESYIFYIKNTCNKIAPGKTIIIKPHRDDRVVYENFNVNTIKGKSLEQYSLKNSTIIGVGSTALITAKVLCECDSVYYIPLEIGFNGLSEACKLLFNKNLQKYIQ